MWSALTLSQQQRHHLLMAFSGRLHQRCVAFIIHLDREKSTDEKTERDSLHGGMRSSVDSEHGTFHFLDFTSVVHVSVVHALVSASLYLFQVGAPLYEQGSELHVSPAGGEGERRLEGVGRHVDLRAAVQQQPCHLHMAVLGQRDTRGK
ncbi:hypothetical protein EYF80_051829 [Liparis tanakae]|uniref:Uncharacterized protein n=1 Tax=Liparis tanakae TaxID=230148 RepID=A0A4Z2FAT8_9TELE|nr:hypothetical protein EYF80_051829 [Liparis tanakae]